MVLPGRDGESWFSRSKVILLVAAGLLTVIIMFIACMADSIHIIPEGKVGIYYKNGALTEGYTPAGTHMSAPFVTEVVQVTVRTMTDSLEPINCVTKDGITNTFYDIKVMSRIKLPSLILMVRDFGVDFKRMLIYDRIAEELRTFCATHEIDQVYNTLFLEIVGEVKKKVIESITHLGGGGITIYNLVIPKPDIPADIAYNYRQVKVRWTEQLVAAQTQKTAIIHKQTEALKAIHDAEREKDVVKIHIMKGILEKEGEKNISKLNNEIIRAAEETKANNEFYKSAKQAESNQKLYTRRYVKLNLAKSLTNNTKIYFSGENSLLGKILEQVLGTQK